MSRTPMTERTSRGSQWRRNSAATKLIYFSVCRASRGSTDAGGEDVGYFAPWKERVRIPPVTHAPWRSPCKGRRAPRLRFFPQGSAGVDVTATELACSPAYPINGRCSHIGRAVVKMPVTSDRAGSIPAHVQGRSPARAATASLVPRQPYPRSVVKIAVTSSVTREVAGSNPARRRMRR